MGEQPSKSFLDRTIDNLLDAWRGIAGVGADTEAEGATLSASGEKRLREQVRDCLEGKGGEVSARTRAARLGQSYLALDAAGRERFLRILATDFGVEDAAAETVARTYLEASGGAAKRQASAQLRGALEAPRVRLLTQFNALPEGVKFLCDMRAFLLELADKDPVFGPLAEDLSNLLRSWFDVGFLELRRITWDAPAALLEKLIAYEAVHEISGWEDLKNRLDSDRRCFAFFHPRMPDEPLIFVEVALTTGIADNIQKLIDPEAPLLDADSANTAIFYSISNAQNGLAGISMGNFLIKRVVDLLSAEFKNVKTFATLSPIPGLRKWLRNMKAEDLLTPSEQKALPKRKDGDQHPLSLIKNPGWYRNDYLAGALKAPLMRHAARYLINEKRASGAALDPVAHFHLTNGARVERINWLADTSARGLRQSAGMMVNYLYRMDEIDANHEAYSGEGRVRTASSVRSQAKG